MPDPLHQAIQAAAQGWALAPGLAAELAAMLPEKSRAVIAAAAIASTSGHEPARFSCGIINAKSGRCGEDCAFCAQSRYHNSTGAPVHPLLGAEKILERAAFLAEHGVSRMGIVASGAAPSDRDLDALCDTARKIREQTGIRLCASLGALNADNARMLLQAGFSSYHHNLETARSFYPSVCTTHSYESRCETVRQAKAAGLRVCSGGLFGLGESWEQRLELAATLRELDVDSIPVNFLMPVPGTRLENAAPLGFAEGLAVIALFRLMHPARDIVICGGRNTTLGEWDRLALFSGANGVMVGDYLTKKGGALERDLLLLREMEGRHA